MNLPLMEPYIISLVTILAGMSFFLPNRMSIWIKLPQIVSLLAIGVTYFAISQAELTEMDKAAIIRIIFFCSALAIIVSNVASSVINHIRKRKLGELELLHHRTDD